MKKKMIESLPYQKAGDGKLFSFYEASTGIWVLDGYEDGKPAFRYALDTNTKEHACLKFPGEHEYWTQQGLSESVGISYAYYYCKSYSGAWEYLDKSSMAAAARFCNLSKDDLSAYSLFSHIIDKEQEHGREKRWNAEQRRIARVEIEMRTIDQDGMKRELDAQKWFTQEMRWDRRYLMKDHTTGEYTCTGCRKVVAIKKARQGQTRICPNCGTDATVENRRKEIRETGNLMIMHTYNGRYQSVARFFDARCVWSAEGTIVQYNEAVRICLKTGRPAAYDSTEAFLRSVNAAYRKQQRDKEVDIYYNTYTRPWGTQGNGKPYYQDSVYFDNKNNLVNRKAGKCLLYPVGIAETVEHTPYVVWTRAFEAAAEGKLRMDYNRFMICHGQEDLPNVVELLIKGRFYRLVEDMADRVSVWSGEYVGNVRIHEQSFEKIMGMDKVRINMLRDVDGNEDDLVILKMACERKMKLSVDVLRFYSQNRIRPDSLRNILKYMSMEAAKNYLERQRRESYPGKDIATVLNQYNDYIDMMTRLHKNTADEMVYRCKELKRRHDECVEEINRLRQIEQMKRDKAYAREQAKELRKKYPTAEAVLNEIRPKFEYKNQNYMILVPRTLSEIVAEGSSLHHCVASTDRYFDRIMQNETYICFLRKVSDPKLPFYTIEVEPGGTVRQHRGMYDEEPNLDEVKEFIKEWQKQLKKKLTKKDRQRAAIAKELRLKNIEDLKRANNTRVLNGLIEDFMDAEVV